MSIISQSLLELSTGHHEYLRISQILLMSLSYSLVIYLSIFTTIQALFTTGIRSATVSLDKALKVSDLLIARGMENRVGKKGGKEIKWNGMK